MNTFTLKGTFIDTPTPTHCACARAICCARTACAPDSARLPPPGWKFSTIRVKSSRRVLWTCICTRRSTAIAARRWIWSCWTGCSSTPTPRSSHYADPAYARLGYSYFVRDLKTAPQRALHLATLHTDATLELMHQLRGAGFPPLLASWPWTATAPTPTVSRAPPRAWPKRAAGWIPAAPKHPCTRARFAR